MRSRPPLLPAQCAPIDVRPVSVPPSISIHMGLCSAVARTTARAAAAFPPLPARAHDPKAVARTPLPLPPPPCPFLAVSISILRSASLDVPLPLPRTYYHPYIPLASISPNPAPRPPRPSFLHHVHVRTIGFLRRSALSLASYQSSVWGPWCFSLIISRTLSSCRCSPYIHVEYIASRRAPRPAAVHSVRCNCNPQPAKRNARAPSPDTCALDSSPCRSDSDHEQNTGHAPPPVASASARRLAAACRPRSPVPMTNARRAPRVRRWRFALRRPFACLCPLSSVFLCDL